MAGKPSFRISVTEGSDGCIARIEEFGIQVAMSTRQDALRSLPRLLSDHCAVLVKRANDKTVDTTPGRVELAKRVNKEGFTLQD